MTAALALRQTLAIDMSGVEAVTDLLDNKAFIELDGNETNLAARPFTDYILSAGTTARCPSPSRSRARASSPTCWSGRRRAPRKNRLTIDALKADGLNVFIIAPQIEVSGEVVGENVAFVAESLNTDALDASSPSRRTN